MKQRYLIAMLPPKGLSIAIDQIRRECSQTFQIYKALRPPVHLTLRFIGSLEESYEAQLISSLNGARNFKPFIQELENFSGFQNARAVYIAGTKNKQIDRLYQQIKVLTKSYGKDLHDSLTPHLTIAYRDVNEAKYQEILDYYQSKTFHAMFEVNHFSLLKHDGSTWNVLRHYYCQSGPEQLEIPL